MRATGPLAALLLLAAGCSIFSGPGPAEVARYDVHVILRLDPPPPAAVALQPTAALGREVRRSRIELGARPREVALFHAAPGERRFSLWAPGLRSGARATLEVDHELWIVVDLGPGRRHARLHTYEQPPDEDIGAWTPLIPLPD